MANWENTELIRLLNANYIRLPANLGARVYRSTNQSIADDGGFHAIDFDTERWDTGITNDYANGFWDVANPTRLTAVKAGWYVISGHIEFDNDPNGWRAVRIRHTDLVPATVTIAAAKNDAPTIGPQIPVTTVYWMNVGEYIELDVKQTSGGALNVITFGNHTPELGMVRTP